MTITRFANLAILATAISLITFKSMANKHHVGTISPNTILENFDKFKRHQNDVEYSPKQLAPLADIEEKITVKVYFGQWCHDSQREVPRLIRLFSQLNNPNFDVDYYALNIRKSDPQGFAKKDKIRKTPTIIVYKNNVELARILEFPKIDWASDLANILDSKVN